VDYRKLKGKIKEVYDTQDAFTKALGMSYASLNLKINNKREWTTNEIVKACELLNIALSDAHLYFFIAKV
jgi:hypothetical protein